MNQSMDSSYDHDDFSSFKDSQDKWDECEECNLADTIQSPESNGYLTFSYDALLAGNAASLTKGDLHLMKLFLECPKRIKGVSVIVFTPASSYTLVDGQNFIGLYSTKGKLLASTGDITSKLKTPGRLDALFTNPKEICGPFYIALLINTKYPHSPLGDSLPDEISLSDEISLTNETSLATESSLAIEAPLADEASLPSMPLTFASIGGGPSAANDLFVTQANRCSVPRLGRIDGSFTSLPNSFNPQDIITPNRDYWVGVF